MHDATLPDEGFCILWKISWDSLHQIVMIKMDIRKKEKKSDLNYNWGKLQGLCFQYGWYVLKSDDVYQQRNRGLWWLA